MIVRHVLRDLLGRIPEWDAASKLSLLVALVLLLVLLWMGFTGPKSIQFPARVGAFGLLLALQLIVLWGNRRQVSPYHQAQHHFRMGEYAAARDILEGIPDSGRASVDALVLLGNTYRHLGELDAAEAAAEHALELRPDYHFALYAAGKVSLHKGRFGIALQHFERALQYGAPDLVAFDAGLAGLLMDDDAQASRFLRQFRAAAVDEPEKTALAQLCLFALGEGEAPDSSAIREHVLFWRNEAEQYAETAYGAALSRLLDQLESAFTNENRSDEG